MSFPTTVPIIQIYAGDTYTQEYVFKDANTGDPIDLDAEGWGNWAAQYRHVRADVNSYDFDVDASDAENGVIIVSMEKETTRLLETNGVWDLQATNGATLRTFLTSQVQVLKDVTRV